MVGSRRRSRAKTAHASGEARRVDLTNLYLKQDHSYFVYESVCDDFTGRQKDHDMNIERITREVVPINGRRYYIYPSMYREYVNYDSHGTRAVGGHINLGWPSVPEIGTAVRAGTNPSRPVVSVPTMIAEAKDFINPIKQAGLVALKKKKLSKVLRRKGRVKEAADAYLSYKFAIEPTIRDLASLLNAQSSIIKRIEELDRLYSKGGLRRRMTVFEGAATTESSLAIESALSIVLSNKITTTTTARSWGTIRWVPTMGRPWKNEKEKVELATKLVLGMNAHNLVATAWELVPWSFMVDWFTNVGDYITATNNTVPAYASHVNVMQHRKTSISWTRSDNHDDFKGGTAVFTRETKRRDVDFGPNLVLSLPFLTGGQLSILGALSASRLGRYE